MHNVGSHEHAHAGETDKLDLTDELRRIYSRDCNDPHVAIVDGHGVVVSVEHGHLVLQDGVGRHRRTRTYSRTERQLRHVVVLARNGSVSVDAMRWCADVGVSIVTIDTETSTVLATSGVRFRDDPKLRRAQALAIVNGSDIPVVRFLLAEKLNGHADVARTRFQDADLAAALEGMADGLTLASAVDELRSMEGTAAAEYFAAWSGMRTGFSERDAKRIPAHWQRFTIRSSTSGGSKREATTPINAMLNYGYTTALAECRIACQAMGIDSGLGMLHVDKTNRDSMALDILETVRPHVDRHVLDIITSKKLRAINFYETRTGQCRLLPPLTHQIAEALPQWSRAAVHTVETVARMLAASAGTTISKTTALTRSKEARVHDMPVPQAVEITSDTRDSPEAAPGCNSCGRQDRNMVDGLCSWCRVGVKARRAQRERWARLAQRANQ